MSVMYPTVPSLFRSPYYSAMAVVPAGASWVIIGGQNAVNTQGEIVGDDLASQAAQVRKNLEAALAAADCNWSHVVRLTVHLKIGVDPREAFAAFGSALASRPSPPLVGVYHVPSLARPQFLLEVGLEAIR